MSNTFVAHINKDSKQDMDKFINFAKQKGLNAENATATLIGGNHFISREEVKKFLKNEVKNGTISYDDMNQLLQKNDSVLEDMLNCMQFTSQKIEKTIRDNLKDKGFKKNNIFYNKGSHSQGINGNDSFCVTLQLNKMKFSKGDQSINIMQNCLKNSQNKEQFAQQVNQINDTYREQIERI